MKSILRKTLLVLAALACVGTASAVPVYEDGTNDLQDVFADLGIGHYDVEADQSNSAYWTHTAVGSTGAYVFSDVGFASTYNGTTSVGVYSAISGERIELFGDAMGTASTTLQFNDDGLGNVSVVAFNSNLNIQTSSNDFGNVFGFYVTFGENTYYSDPSMNPSYTAFDDGNTYSDWAVMYQGDGSMMNRYNGRAGGEFSTNDWLIAFSGVPHLDGQLDFNDTVFLMESILPVAAPAPAALALMGIGLLGLVANARKRAA